MRPWSRAPNAANGCGVGMRDNDGSDLQMRYVSSVLAREMTNLRDDPSAPPERRTLAAQAVALLGASPTPSDEENMRDAAGVDGGLHATISKMSLWRLRSIIAMVGDTISKTEPLRSLEKTGWESATLKAHRIVLAHKELMNSPHGAAALRSPHAGRQQHQRDVPGNHEQGDSRGRMRGQAANHAPSAGR